MNTEAPVWLGLLARGKFELFSARESLAEKSSDLRSVPFSARGNLVEIGSDLQRATGPNQTGASGFTPAPTHRGPPTMHGAAKQISHGAIGAADTARTMRRFAAHKSVGVDDELVEEHEVLLSSPRVVHI